MDATRASRGSAWRRFSPCSQPWCSGWSETLRRSLWGLAAIVAAIGFAIVLSGNWLVLAWCATAAGAAVLSSLVDEERLTYGAAGYLAIALVYTLGDLAAPRDFFSANTEPAAGVAQRRLGGRRGARDAALRKAALPHGRRARAGQLRPSPSWRSTAFH